jgi:hypothetical protein
MCADYVSNQKLILGDTGKTILANGNHFMAMVCVYMAKESANRMMLAKSAF